MTPERKKVLWLMSAVLLIGILIGALGTGLVGREVRRPQRSGHHKEMFTNRILTAIKADKEQAKQITPLISESITKIDSLQRNAENDVQAIINLFEQRAKPLLSEEQFEHLKEFHRKGRERRK